MLTRLASVAIGVALAIASASACAMTAAANDSAHCRVIGGEKLPAGSGGADALCSAVAAAAAEKAPGTGYHVEITVLPQSRLSAAISTGDGRKIAERGIASMDKPLTVETFNRFAATIAAEIAKADGSKS